MVASSDVCVVFGWRSRHFNDHFNDHFGCTELLVAFVKQAVNCDMVDGIDAILESITQRGHKRVALVLHPSSNPFSPLAMKGKKNSNRSQHPTSTDVDVFPTFSCDDFPESMDHPGSVWNETTNKQTRLWIEDYHDRR